MQLSIILPYDGYSNYLKDCLESISQQELTDFETLLLVNEDHKEIENIITEYKDLDNIKVISCGETSSVASKRNVGLNEAKGDYVFFIDSDDYLMKNALNPLLKLANDSNLDLVTGTRMISWFKKEVFETMGEEKNTELAIKDKDNDRNTKFLEKDYSEHEEPMVQRMIDILLRSRKGLKNVSVLNILIKRDIISKHSLRFNEKFSYYSDLPFLCALLKYSNTFDNDASCIYVKRKHNDPINTPALSQIKDPDNKFDEFIEAYKYTRSLLSDNELIRHHLETKMLKYYCNYFAKKIRRSEDDFWRNERFDTMCSLMKEIDETGIKPRKHYQRKMLKLAKNHDLEGTKKTINVHLAKAKAKRTLKNKNEINKYLYRHKYNKEPIEENWVMFETFMGKSYADSPKYIYEYLAKNYPGKYKFIWVLNDKHEKLPYEGEIVKRFSKKYAYYLAKSKYFVFNIRQPLWFRKREGQVFLETWHGTPLKRLAFDQEEVTAASPTYKAQFFRQKQEWDYLIADNKFSSDIFKSCFMYDGNMLEIGYPRNDLLYADNKEELANNLKNKLGIPKNKKTILYAPTWRDDEYYGNGQYKLELKLNLKLMQEQLSDEYVVLLRTHHYIADKIDISDLKGFAYNLSSYDDITEIYLISDICITDYSSVFFDYANLKRPMLFYTYDLDKYRDILRGFYIDMEKELPGPLLFTSEEVVNSIKNIDSITEKYQKRYDEFYNKFCNIDDGNASKRAVEAVFK
ncbi:MAG: CDP-glycerol glycerophosphotransferase family protein [Thomasclavelia sp.]|nr:CDP-glycerol glycerophosphotransferase family protein [Thomasclavelia sp.]